VQTKNYGANPRIFHAEKANNDNMSEPCPISSIITMIAAIDFLFLYFGMRQAADMVVTTPNKNVSFQ
jgi:hypothetical protein